MNRREEVVPIGPRRAPREYGSVYCGVASGPLEVKGTTAMRLRRCVLGVAVATMFVVFSIWPLISQASPLSTVRNRTVVNNICRPSSTISSICRRSRRGAWSWHPPRASPLHTSRYHLNSAYLYSPPDVEAPPRNHVFAPRIAQLARDGLERGAACLDRVGPRDFPALAFCRDRMTAAWLAQPWLQ